VSNNSVDPEATLYGVLVLGGIGTVVFLAFASWKTLLLLIGALFVTWFAVALIQGWIDRDTANREGIRKEHEGLAARADEQHALYLRGDREGIYGRFMPVDLEHDSCPPPHHGSQSVAPESAGDSSQGAAKGRPYRWHEVLPPPGVVESAPTAIVRGVSEVRMVTPVRDMPIFENGGYLGKAPVWKQSRSMPGAAGDSSQSAAKGGRHRGSELPPSPGVAEPVSLSKPRSVPQSRSMPGRVGDGSQSAAKGGPYRWHEAPPSGVVESAPKTNVRGVSEVRTVGKAPVWKQSRSMPGAAGDSSQSAAKGGRHRGSELPPSPGVAEPVSLSKPRSVPQSRSMPGRVGDGSQSAAKGGPYRWHEVPPSSGVVESAPKTNVRGVSEVRTVGKSPVWKQSRSMPGAAGDSSQSAAKGGPYRWHEVPPSSGVVESAPKANVRGVSEVRTVGKSPVWKQSRSMPGSASRGANKGNTGKR